MLASPGSPSRIGNGATLRAGAAKSQLRAVTRHVGLGLVHGLSFTFSLEVSPGGTKPELAGQFRV